MESVLDKGCTFTSGVKSGSNKQYGIKMKKISVDFDALSRVVYYLEHDEKRHYEEYDRKPIDHIWLSVKMLKNSIENYNRK